MSLLIDQSEINAILWRACDTFRGTVDPSEYKNYLLTMLFVKYISDVWQDHYDALKAEYGDDEDRIRRRLERDRFVMPEGTLFKDLYAQRGADNLGEIIDQALLAIEDANKGKLSGVFRNISFNSEAALGQTKERNIRLKNLLEDFHHPKLDLRPSRIGNLDIIGNAYEYLIGRFAAGAGKKAGEFYTPPEVSDLMARLTAPQPGERIYDPTCGSGSLLIKCAQNVQAQGSQNYAIYGQEQNGSTYALARMNMFLHGVDDARIEWGDTIRNPLHLEDDKLMKFEVVVANPPFSLDKWGAEDVSSDRHKRFERGIPPKGKGDYAFISHMLGSLAEVGSRMVVVVPHGVLFRGAAEGKIRARLIEEGLLDAVIGLPTNLFFGTGIPAALLVFRKGAEAQRNGQADVLFIDASREFAAGKNQNQLREADIVKIVDTYRARNGVDKYARVVPLDEIAANDYNLNIPRYVDTSEEAEPIDLGAVQTEINALESQWQQQRQKMAEYLRELGL
ncbi:type I restriction-modification system, M subunit [Deinococcus proteolyticus MRP]|uniref:site-specific DNA-methyltransferase (adenine-specific) n=1 Tax=Deinococcus proteolyticus (strain ATCC 35074 / DSM 20540 / JCM 6276 / NBRC 101906 / NCIMB 13154 / VKM Ac-1939 / CCM 2703 / MRP) TaxID=693977 RepID=F0RJY9_DEIPM|nr:type I restriction-modification system subunit M [Deinococcus proteolyticus]ADY26635.1 type I restriction-modification system, M subunit [Deinococcus proteolyticus MRP]